jgi:magnesium chelatase subunit D
MSLVSAFPFVALVGLDTLKLALTLSAIDTRLSVLIRGDKGAGKSTAARGLVQLLPAGSPFVNLPIGATEDRLLGGLDLSRTLAGEPALKPGLVAGAHGGVLYVDEVNLLADHLADALLDSAASGVLVVEREGFSVTQPTEFVLLGSMNPEEGALRPQLLDRFALVVDVAAPMDPIARAAVLERRLAYDEDAGGFSTAWRSEGAALAQQIAEARERVSRTVVTADLRNYIAEKVARHGVRSLRADLAVARASRAYGALVAADSATADHVETVWPMALVHRLPRGSERPDDDQPPRQGAREHSPEQPSDNDGDGDGDGRGPGERVFDPMPHPAPRLVVQHVGNAGGSANGKTGSRVGREVGTRRTESPAELDVRTSLVHAIARSGTVGLQSDDLHERVRAPLVSTRFILVVDSSGSHAVLERMRLVKGVAHGLLDASIRRHDEIVVIGCRGPRANVLVEPTSSRDEAERALEYLPTGGRTPLAHGLELAAGYVTDEALLILITDGRANVPTRTEDPWADARHAAGRIRCAALVVDTEDPRTATGRPRELAEALRGVYTKLDELDPSQILSILRIHL